MVNLFLSSLSQEGKTVVARNIAWKLKKQGKKVLFLNYPNDFLRPVESNPDLDTDTTTLVKSIQVPSQKHFRFIRRMFGYPDNRIDSFSPFLQKPDVILDRSEYFTYKINPKFISGYSYKDLLEVQKDIPADATYDFILIEIPPILYNSYPSHLIASADLAIVVGRSNRVWSEADQKALDLLTKITSQKPVFLLNGVEVEVIESVLGDLPKKRSWLRRMAKSMVRFQFNSKNEL